MLLQLILSENVNIGAIWEVYKMMQDNEDFLESLKVLLSVK